MAAGDSCGHFRFLRAYAVAHRLSDGPNMQAVAQHIWLPELMQSCAPLPGGRLRPVPTGADGGQIARATLENQEDFLWH